MRGAQLQQNNVLNVPPLLASLNRRRQVFKGQMFFSGTNVPLQNAVNSTGYTHIESTGRATS